MGLNLFLYGWIFASGYVVMDQNEGGLVVESTETVVSCSGGAGLEHPKVYLHMEDQHQVACYYCGRIFVYVGKQKDALR